MTDRQKKAAKAAIDVQDACNAGGVSRLLHEAIAAEIEVVGTTPAIGESPAVRLILCKLFDLLGYDGSYNVTGGSFGCDYSATEWELSE